MKPYPWRRNFSLVVRYSLKFVRRSLLVVKSLVARCKIPWLLVAEIAHCKKSPVTRCKICSLLVAEVAHCKKSVVTRCRLCSLLVAKVARYKKIVRYSFWNLLITRCRSCSFQQITGSHCKIHWILLAKNHSLLKESPAGIIVSLKSTKLGESFSFFIIICYLRPKNSTLPKSTYYP